MELPLVSEARSDPTLAVEIAEDERTGSGSHHAWQWVDVGRCRIVDARTAAAGVDLEKLLQSLPTVTRAGVVLYRRGEEDLATLLWPRGVKQLHTVLGVVSQTADRVEFQASHLEEMVSRLERVQGLPPVEVPGPRYAMVEIVRRCNLRCPVCPIGSKLADNYPDMKLTTFRHFLDTYARSLVSLRFENYGEAILHPQVGDFIRAAREAGIPHVALTTNGNYLPAEVAEQVVASGLDVLRFSVDTSDQAAYQQYRVGGRLERVLANMRLLAQVRARAGADRPMIEAQALHMSSTEHALGQFESDLRAAGADQIRWKTFNVFMSGSALGELGKQFAPRTVGLRRHEGDDPQPASHSQEMQRCPWPWDKIVVLASGAIVPCCRDYNGQHELGHMAGPSPALWNTEARRAFMIRWILHPHTIPMCTTCPTGVPRLGLRLFAVPEGTTHAR
ncbi:MAG: radical SAM protein [Gemmataceae bacterium]